MSHRVHCDVCDEVLPDDGRSGGHVSYGSVKSYSDSNSPVDLCQEHYDSFKDAVREWRNNCEPVRRA